MSIQISHYVRNDKRIVFGLHGILIYYLSHLILHLFFRKTTFYEGNLMSKFKFLIILVIACFYFHLINLVAQNIQNKIDSIQVEIEKIRGAKFKHSVKVANQSLEDFGKYLDKMLDKQFSENMDMNYGKVVRKLGLYRGPEIKDFKSLAKAVMQSQAAAYYDPASSTFYVVMQDLPKSAVGSVYAHELYHGFQDQHYNLNSYLLSPVQGKLNDDEVFARQAVVEGEATYLMTLWTLKTQFGSVPAPGMLEMAIKMQAKLDVKTMLQMLKSSVVPLAKSADMEKAIKAMDDIPPFMIETMVGAYLKGMGFVFEIQKQGWEKVSELYKNPPVSSEQILHPEKWLANEFPVKFEWPSFAQKLFSDWKLLESNTVGEIQWRIIFSEHGMGEAGLTAAEGWNGDSFAIFEHKKNGKLLLLVCSSWDTEKEAREFKAAYEKLLAVKYPEGNETIKIQSNANDVLIIEGGRKKNVGNFLEFLRQAKKTKSGSP